MWSQNPKMQSLHQEINANIGSIKARKTWTKNTMYPANYEVRLFGMDAQIVDPVQNNGNIRSKGVEYLGDKTN